jgi:hypothetical protein
MPEDCVKTKVQGAICSLGLAGVALLLADCSSQIAQKSSPAPVGMTAGAQAQKGPAVEQSSVNVIPNPYEDDPYRANLAVEATKRVLQARGYNLVENGTTAQLIAIPTVETKRVQLVRQSASAFDVFQELEQPGRPLGLSASVPMPAVKLTTTVNGKANAPILVIEAFRTDDWNHALLVNMLQLPPVWKVVTALPVGYSADPLDLERTGGPKTEFQLPSDRLLTNATNH